MLQDARIEKLAEVLVRYSLGVQPGWQVSIQTMPLAAPLVAALYRQVLAAGGFPSAQVALPETADVLLKEGNDAQLQYVAPLAMLPWEQTDAVLNIAAETNTRANSGVPPERMALAQKGRAPLTAQFM